MGPPRLLELEVTLVVTSRVHLAQAEPPRLLALEVSLVATSPVHRAQAAPPRLLALEVNLMTTMIRALEGILLMMDTTSHQHHGAPVPDPRHLPLVARLVEVSLIHVFMSEIQFKCR